MTLPEIIAAIGWDEAERRFRTRGRTDNPGRGLWFSTTADPVDGHHSVVEWVWAFCIGISAVCHRQKFIPEEVEANPDLIRALAIEVVATAPTNRSRRYSLLYNQNGVAKLPRGGWLTIGMRAQDAAKHGRGRPTTTTTSYGGRQV